MIERRSFLVGALAGVTTGGATGLTAGLAGPPGKRLPDDAQYSYAQNGEDPASRRTTTRTSVRPSPN
jgi:hypothetical protein